MLSTPPELTRLYDVLMKRRILGVKFRELAKVRGRGRSPPEEVGLSVLKEKSGKNGGIRKKRKIGRPLEQIHDAASL
jgi:hypothetical protein